MLLNDGVIKNNANVIIFTTWPMLKFLLKSKDVLYQVSSDLGEVNSFYSSFPDTVQEAPLPFKSSKKSAWYRVKNCWSGIFNSSLKKQDSSRSTSETVKNVYLFVFIILYYVFTVLQMM